MFACPSIHVIGKTQFVEDSSIFILSIQENVEEIRQKKLEFQLNDLNKINETFIMISYI